MSKYRVYELAKDYNTTSKLIIDILARNNMVAKNHMSSVDEDAKAVIERTFARKTGNEAPVEEAKRPVSPARTEDNRQGQMRQQQPRAPQQQQQHQQQQQRPGFQQSRPSTPQPQAPRPGQQPQQSQQQGRPPVNQTNNRPPMQQRPGGNQPPRTSHYQQPRQPNQPVSGGQPQAPRQGQPYGSSQGQRPVAQQQRPHDQGFNASNQRRPDNRPADNRQAPGQQRPHQPFNQPRTSPAGGAPQQQTGQQGQQGHQRNDNRGGNRPQQGGNRQRPSGQQDRRGSTQNKYQQGNRQRSNTAQNKAKIEVQRPKVVKLGSESMTVKELSAKFGREVGEIIKKLMMLGVMATINQEIDMDTAKILASEFEITVEELPPAEDPTEIPDVEDSPESLLARPPVVTIMGHVDHGKTSLLDAIRQTNVSSQEAGGITQQIGAYQVNYQNNKIVFLDTPGHEAFTAMRARGAQVTDIAVLVVAADDGVMPQTIEAINHAKSAKVPIIVAVNKIDRPGANLDRIKQQLTEQELVSEEWGGDTIVVPVSAKAKTGITDLLEMILLVAEVQDLKANPNRLAVGTIIEAELDKGRGPVATVLVQKGTLHIGDTIIAGTAYGKVRAMMNDRGDKVKKATPSTPVEVLGLSDVPMAGDILAVVDENTARAVAEKRVSKKRIEDMGQMQKVTLDDLFAQIQEGKLKDLNIVIKADMQGSIEALRQAFAGMKNKEVRVSLVHTGVGAINESDVMLASASNALIIGFNVRPDTNARKAAETEKVDIRTYRVIYDVVNDVEAAMLGMLAPEYKEVIQGRVEVRKVISVPKAVVAGCYVLEGKITNNSQLRIVRNGIVVHEGHVESLRRFKDEVKEVATGYECGISIEKYRDVKEGDILEAFTMELVARPTGN